MGTGEGHFVDFPCSPQKSKTVTFLWLQVWFPLMEEYSRYGGRGSTDDLRYIVIFFFKSEVCCEK